MIVKRSIKITFEQFVKYVVAMACFDAQERGVKFKPEDYYFGLTKNPKERAQQHGCDPILVHNVLDREIAGELEVELGNCEFYVGKPDKGGDEDSTYVYLYRRTENTNP